MNNPESKGRMTSYVKQINTLMKQKCLTTGLICRIENSLMLVNFREKKGLKIKREKDLLEEYIDFLIISRLKSELEVNRVAEEMLRLPWDSQPVA
jgi:hypothetical protein